MKLSTIQKVPNTATRRRLIHQYVHEKKVASVRDQILTCDNCILRKEVKAPVPWSGPTPAPLVFVGEGPGAEEDRFGIPFVGRAGQLFDHLLTQAQLNRDEVVVLNVVCCRPPENRDPLPAEIAACKPNLEAQLSLAGAWVGVTLGAYALAAITGRTRSEVKITAERGRPISIDGRIWIPTFHPAYALRNTSASKQILDDIRSADNLQKGEESLPSDEYMHAVVDTDSTLIDQLGDRGWALIRSSRIMDLMVVMKDAQVSVPQQLLDNYVVYTMEELMRLGEIGQGASFTTDDYQRIHLVKREFGAMVVS